MRLQSSIRDNVTRSVPVSENYKVQFGKVLSLEETAVGGQLYDFKGGQVKLKGRHFVRDFSLMKNAEGALLTDDIAGLFDDNMDALWVRSRIMHDFKTAPVPVEKQLKTALSEFHFIAIERYGDEVDAFPFVCSDYNGCAALIFSPYGPSQAIQRKISSDFWYVMLENPENLFDYDAVANLDGLSVHFGCRNNKFYYEDA